MFIYFVNLTSQLKVEIEGGCLLCIRFEHSTDIERKSWVIQSVLLFSQFVGREAKTGALVEKQPCPLQLLSDFPTAIISTHTLFCFMPDGLSKRSFHVNQTLLLHMSNKGHNSDLSYNGLLLCSSREVCNVRLSLFTLFQTTKNERLPVKFPLCFTTFF